MTKIKFGTDGWRAIIAQEYTVDNVSRVAKATADWMISKNQKTVVVGYDCRFGGVLFSETVCKVFASQGIKVLYDKNFVSTPMVSLGIVKLKADLGVVITASHNPHTYNGYKLKSAYGGPTIPKDIAEVENLIQDEPHLPKETFDAFVSKGMIEYIDLEKMYIQHIEQNFDMAALKTMGKSLAYDAMYGAGQNVMKKLFPDARLLHCDYNPSFMGQAPEPIHRNLSSLSSTIANHDHLKFGIANDGDADRIGMYDGDGKFVDSHHLLLLLLKYLYEHKNLRGKVVYTFSVTDKMKMLSEKYGLDYEVTKIGFKYIAGIMINEDVLVGGEESGGLAVKGHIPERDGIWMGLLIMEYMAKTGKTIKELIQDLYSEVGSFAFDRDDLHITEEIKLSIIEKCSSGHITQLGDRTVIRTETIDGFKFYLSEDEWVMVRPSGTEPVLRVYAQAPDSAGVRSLLDKAHKSLQS